MLIPQEKRYYWNRDDYHLAAFVITVSAFSFVILNVGFLMSDKAQTTVITGMKENNRSFLANVPGDFKTTTTACS